MCSTCQLETKTLKGDVVRVIRRCSRRNPEKDKGSHLAVKKVLVIVDDNASRGEGIYGYVYHENIKGIKKTRAHFRDCEYEQTNYKWVEGKLANLSIN
jgi:hypothetical protein